MGFCGGGGGGRAGLAEGEGPGGHEQRHDRRVLLGGHGRTPNGRVGVLEVNGIRELWRGANSPRLIGTFPHMVQNDYER